MFRNALSRCPVCDNEMERGFSGRTVSLSWIPLEKMQQFAFVDEDLNEAGWKKYMPAKAAYDLSYHCPECKIYIVDYAKSYSRREANELAK